MQAGAGRRAMEHPGGGIQVGPAWQRRPLRAVHPMKGETHEREARRHLHTQKPVELPATLLHQQRLGPLPPIRPDAASAQQIQGGQQLPDRQHAAGHVFAVIAGVVPAPGYIEAPRTRPVRIQPLSVLAGPHRHRSIARVTRRTAIARCPHLVDRSPAALEVEERKHVTRQRPVQLRRHRERMAACTADLHGETGPLPQVREVQRVDCSSRRRLWPHRPRKRLTVRHRRS